MEFYNETYYFVQLINSNKMGVGRLDIFPRTKSPALVLSIATRLPSSFTPSGMLGAHDHRLMVSRRDAKLFPHWTHSVPFPQGLSVPACIRTEDLEPLYLLVFLLQLNSEASDPGTPTYPAQRSPHPAQPSTGLLERSSLSFRELSFSKI